MTETCIDGMILRVEKSNQALPLRPAGEAWQRMLLFTASFIAYVLCLGPGAYWIDSGELAGAGASLGLAHPPGQPLYSILAYTAAQLPIGTIGFRISMVSGLFASLSVVLVYDLVLCCLNKTHREPAVHRAFAGVAALAFACSGGLILQAVRAEVYTLNLAILLFALRLAFECRSRAPAYDISHMLKIAFLLSLGLANHHLLVIAFFPPLLIWLFHERAGREAARKHGLSILLVGISGFIVYAYLPLRALTDPLFNFGDPRTFDRFIDVVTARSFQGSVGGESVDFSENVLAAVDMLSVSLSSTLIVLSIVGSVLVARIDRWVFITLMVAIASNLATKLVMVLDPANPDAAGYFLPSMALLSVLGGTGLALIFGRPRPVAKIAAATGGLFLAWVTFDGSVDHFSRYTQTDTRSPAVVDTWLVKDMPPGSILMPIHPQLSFNRLYHASIDGYRPDVLTVHQSMDRRIDGGAPYAEYMSRRDSEIGPLLEAGVKTGKFPLQQTLELSHTRPVFIEPHNQLEADIPLDLLEPSGIYSQLSARSDSHYMHESTTTFREVTRLVQASGTLGNDEKRILGYLAASTAILRLKQGAGQEASDALQTIELLFPKLDVMAIPVTWGRHRSSLGGLSRALTEAKVKGRSGHLSYIQMFARHGDYSGLLPR